MNPRHIPNIITVIRIVMVWPVVAFMLERDFVWALGLFIFAGLSDGLDGFLAKRYGWQSRLGSYLDPLADKLLLVSSYIASTTLGLIPVWLTATVILRDVIIVAGAAAFHLLAHPFEGRPHWSSKANTFMQLVLIVAVLAQQVWLGSENWGIHWLIPIVFVTTAGSGAWYVWDWTQRYLSERTIDSSKKAE